MGCTQRPSHDFDAIYDSETPPAWDIGRPQPAFDRLAKAGNLVGSVLDAGCGTGEHALLAASLGHGVVGVDLSAKAIELAMSKATERGVGARFLVADALRLVDLGEQFHTVLDCGLLGFSGFDGHPPSGAAAPERMPIMETMETEEAPSPSVVHPGVQGRDRRALPAR